VQTILSPPIPQKDARKALFAMLRSTRVTRNGVKQVYSQARIGTAGRISLKTAGSQSVEIEGQCESLLQQAAQLVSSGYGTVEDREIGFDKRRVAITDVALVKTIVRMIALTLLGAAWRGVIASCAEAPPEDVKLLCDVEIRTVSPYRMEPFRTREQVRVNVQRISRWLYVEATGKELSFSIDTHSTSVENHSDENRVQLSDTAMRGDRKSYRQLTIDRTTGSFSYFMNEPGVGQQTATGACAKLNTDQRVF
jgi:hypothetical protein